MFYFVFHLLTPWNQIFFPLYIQLISFKVRNQHILSTLCDNMTYSVDLFIESLQYIEWNVQI